MAGIGKKGFSVSTGWMCMSIDPVPRVGRGEVLSDVSRGQPAMETGHYKFVVDMSTKLFPTRHDVLAGVVDIKLTGEHGLLSRLPLGNILGIFNQGFREQSGRKTNICVSVISRPLLDYWTAGRGSTDFPMLQIVADGEWPTRKMKPRRETRSL